MEEEEKERLHREKAVRMIRMINGISFTIGVMLFFSALAAHLYGGGERNLATFSAPLLFMGGVGMILGILISWFSSHTSVGKKFNAWLLRVLTPR